MIGSFWSLCRACPSMPVDKLHSEYRSTYRWHEYTGPRQEVVRRAPQGGQGNAVPPSDERRIEFHTTRIDEESHEMPKLEPAMPRRKKYPDLAYRHHEFVPGETRNAAAAGGGGMLAHDGGDVPDGNASLDRARSEERGVSHWRPSRRSRSEGPARTNRPLTTFERRRRDSDPDIPNTDDTFAWPQGHTSRRDAAAAAAAAANNAADAPRKSQSMGALKPAANAIIHRKRNDCEPRDGNASELEPLVNDSNTIREDDYKPYALYSKDFKYFKPYARDYRHEIPAEEAAKHLLQNGDAPKSEWIRECVELRKKAGEYKNRGWGSKLAPELDIYNKQVELWDQVSRRSSLSALSLASTAPRNYTKEEKDHENTKKSSPTKALRNAENTRLMKDMIRHHLERTTGGTEFDGLILSPTREKLEPTIPKRDDDSRGSQKNSPKKGSPQKTALQKKNSLKSKSALKTARSQSVGPSDMTSTEKRSPKRQSRSTVAAPNAPKEKKAPSPAAPIVAVNGITATPTANTITPPVAVKRPRPSSLNTTTASSRSKSSSVPSKHEDERLVKSKSNKTSSHDSHAPVRHTVARRGRSASEKTEKNAPEVAEPDPIDLEPVVKSPPEPTRVKSPEQIMIRSPDPVNWTVPLDTGKTFTVTQNVREGDLAARPHSEIKAWTPPDMPPPIAQSAPPQLTEPPQPPPPACTETAGRLTASTAPYSSQSSVVMTLSQELPPELMVPTAGPSSVSLEADEEEPARSVAGDVLQMARDRFDAFWGRASVEEV